MRPFFSVSPLRAAWTALFIGFSTSCALAQTPASPTAPPAPMIGIPVVGAVPKANDGGLAARLQKDIDALTALPSRVPGTPGNLAAAAYVQKRFQEIGLKPGPAGKDRFAQEYLVTAPVTKGVSTLSLGGQTLPVLPVYPNQVVPSTTPKEGISGPLIYGKMGRAQDFKGKKVEGTIVALDFNSGLNWITAADLGAKAIVFLQPDSSSRGQAERKFALLPVEVPRFYAPAATAAAIRNSGDGAQGVLKARVSWERVKALNIVGFLAGTAPPHGKDEKDLKPNTIIINGYYDSMSVVPDDAPGAEAAGNLAALLELARRFKAKPPTYNVLFVANGAHHLALAGVRNFLADNVIDKEGKADDDQKALMASYRAFFNVDLTSQTSTIGLFAKSSFYNQMGSADSLLLNQFAPLAKDLGRYADELGRAKGIRGEQFFVDGITGKDGRNWRSYLPSLVAMDSEAATMAAVPGVSFATANDGRLMQDTPFDTREKLKLPNLVKQIETTDLMMRRAAQAIDESDAKPMELTLAVPPAANLSKIFGFATARAIYRDVKKTTSFLPDTPLPDDALPMDYRMREEPDADHPDQKVKKLFIPDGTQAVGSIGSDRNGAPQEYKSYSGVRGLMIERAVFSKGAKDINPVAQFIFIGPRVGDSKGGGTPASEFEAYSLDPNGHIVFAPDRGSERQRFSPNFNKATASLSWKDEKLQQRNVDASLITFPCRAVTVFDTLDQRYFTVLREMAILDAATDASPVEYGYLRPNGAAGVAEIEPIGIVFSHPGDQFKLIMAAGLLGKRLVLLRTGTSELPKKPITFEGGGFVVSDTAEANAITKIAYQSALDLWTLNQQRIRLLKGFGINNERVDALHGEAGCPIDDKNPTKEDGSPNYVCPRESIAQPTGGALLLAQTALGNLNYDEFYQQARKAFGLESRAYPDVEATSQDVLKGIIFYLALLLPFSYFVERMIFGFPDIRKQIAGTSFVFLCVFGAIRMVHPAFELALTPFIILLAFVILALTVVVTAFLQSKFEAEIKRLKQGVHFADVGRLSALGAAVGLGIANMRRRPTRTALTCVTLILLTFTVLSFTSVTANIANFARPWGDESRTPAYQGFLVRQPDWTALPEVAVSSLSNEFSAPRPGLPQGFGAPALRAWFLSRDQNEALQLRVSSVEDPTKFYYAPALLGLTPQETTIGSPIANKENIIKGRWFQDGDTDVCLVPRDILLSDDERAKERPDADASATPTPVPTPAEGEDAPLPPDTGPRLGYTLDNVLGKKIQVSGKILTVIGVFDDRAWYGSQGEKNLHDLDNEEFTPVDYSSDTSKQSATASSQASAQGGEVQVQRYQHMAANALLILPYETAMGMGATTRSVAVGIQNSKDAEVELNELMNRAALGIFGATPDKTTGKLTSKLYSSVEATSYEGFASLAIPVLIAALIIANTMLGSVYERTREISIYSSVGLAPVHVAALFIAEAAVYAVLGSISGYLIAQITAKIITATNLLPGITLNYSSSSAVLSTLIVMATVLGSTIYPAVAAGRLSQPDANRKSDLGEPQGDLWRLQFPFTVSGLQSLGMAQFLADYFETHTDTSVGKFYTDKVFFSALPLREAVEVLNGGIVAFPNRVEGKPNGNGPKKPSRFKKAKPEDLVPKPIVEEKSALIDIAGIAAKPETQVFRLSMRTWLAPFDMGVSQDTDIILLPSAEPGLYELQLRLNRQSGEIAAWRRVNREFMTDLRKQLLLWRTIKPAGQQEYILRGRAHVAGHPVPTEEPGAVVA